MFQVSITLVFEVLACWPPGPPLPEKRQCSSPAGIVQRPRHDEVTARRQAPVDTIGGRTRGRRLGCSGLQAQPGSTASIAVTTSVAPGSVSGRKRTTDPPPGATRNFSKFQVMSPALPSASATLVSST